VIVFVHGVPETARLWDKLRAAVGRESVAVSLPGFGCMRPPEFGATKDEYVEWLLGEIDRAGEPVDLVGHDWGAALTYRVATRHGDRVRSWVLDVGNIFHPDYVWHDVAQIWQTPEAGEAFFAAQQQGSPEDRAAIFESMGVPRDDALAMAASGDETMGTCILDLYRSATPNPYADWRDAHAKSAAPGLVLHPTDDPFSDEAMASEVADTLGARLERLEGLGHFWPVQGPDQAAATLVRFWDSL
jgi:pimeloyl-ACP methyl ester carboxylesterase